MNKYEIGKHIKEERMRLHLTQEKLAEDVGLSTAYIGQIERGDRNLSLDNLVNVANKLGVTIDYLLSESINADSEDVTLIQISQLLNNRPLRDRQFAVNVLKILFAYLDNK
ncbi:MAG: helix-turn-helix domain-containing protein [Acetatifactor sp.]|nr:helix-turn-helix domain-containing protein [Acetatifactor sp.]